MGSQVPGSPHIHLSIIIPTYNEKENLEVLLFLLHEHLKSVRGPAQEEPGGPSPPRHAAWWWEVVIVDDNSPDGTAEVVKRLQQEDPQGLGYHLQLVQRPGKLGLGTAYAAGLTKAGGEWVLLMDADLSHHPKYLPLMLATQAATGCDVVSSTRYKPGGGVSGWSWQRKLTSRGANLLASVLLGAKQSDLTGAYRLYRRRCLQHILGLTTCRGYAFQMEVALRAQYLGYHVEEVPIIFVDRLYGISKLGPSEFVGFLVGVVRLFFTL